MEHSLQGNVQEEVVVPNCELEARVGCSSAPTTKPWQGMHVIKNVSNLIGLIDETSEEGQL